MHYTLRSRLLDRALPEIGIVPPPGRATGSKRWLIVFLHGRHDPTRLHFLGADRTGPESLLDNALFAALAKLGARAPVVVALDGGGHSYYHDRRDGPWATSVLDEAIPDAIKRFHIRGAVAIGGISMGGYGALHLASLRPHEFCAVGGHSAALWTTPGASAPGAFDDADDWRRNDVFAAARNGRFAGLKIWIDGGDDDPFRVADAAFVHTLQVRGVDPAYHVWPGGHDRAYWDAHLAAYMRFYADACMPETR